MKGSSSKNGEVLNTNMDVSMLEYIHTYIRYSTIIKVYEIIIEVHKLISKT